MSVDPLRPSAESSRGAAAPVAAPLDPRPVALIRLAALAQNLRDAREAGFAVVDRDVLSADAWGHGAGIVERAVSSAGMAWADSGRAGALGGARLFGLPGSSGRPVMTLTGRVIMTKLLRRGEGVSYGYTFRAPSDTTIALVRGGYGQGIVRRLGNRVAVRVEGRDAPVVGRVAMDVCVVDLGPRGTVSPGAPAVFFGDPDQGEPALGSWTAATGLSADEIVAIVGVAARRETS
ncbi:alanine racemase C-terminal domain-containing protein [Microbacterium sp. ET2]|uniref:alanine racemase C-terminal domain-containing protein n=1 Tax=Microbacterium albipurpureum TaxID=3050384 RepID=UPI00259CEBC4|nr:alanine racemase C-terminal domain-containing protein [Microbacterium sp. ET2 (Ac-2212)]WJL95515.1 alanine racemase C-terminal domain-containing protein [Microbacterium sp. ET2 (Ac-2212)]